MRKGSEGGARLRRRWLLAMVLVALVVAAWPLHKSRTYQVLGEIVPRVETSRRVVALTFDDGPTPGHAGRILDLLRDLQVRATFFVTGRDGEAHPELLRRMVADGHELGNHTFSHSRLVLKSLSFVREEIERTDEIIRAAGYTGPIHFRPPNGKKLLVLPYYLWRTGRTTVMWDLEPESCPEIASDARRIRDYVVSRVRPGSILLLHVMYGQREESVKAVELIVNDLRARGYGFVTVSELLALRER